MAAIAAQTEHPMLASPPIRANVIRDATFLFTDMEASSAVASAVGEEAYAEMVIQHVSLVSEVTQGCHCDIHQFAGDGALALWIGARRAAERGLEAALALLLGTARTNSIRRAEGKPWRRVRIGLHVGTAYVVAGPAGFGSLAIGGDLMIARRVEQAGRGRGDGTDDAILTATGALLRAAGLSEVSGGDALYNLSCTPDGRLTLEDLGLSINSHGLVWWRQSH